MRARGKGMVYHPNSLPLALSNTDTLMLGNKRLLRRRLLLLLQVSRLLATPTVVVVVSATQLVEILKMLKRSHSNKLVELALLPAKT